MQPGAASGLSLPFLVPATGNTAVAGGFPLQVCAPQLLSDSLVQAGDVNMSLVIRASRNLPIQLMASEFEGILKRRLTKVGLHTNLRVLVWKS